MQTVRKILIGVPEYPPDASKIVDGCVYFISFRYLTIEVVLGE
jgi:hypothetical protein